MASAMKKAVSGLFSEAKKTTSAIKRILNPSTDGSFAGGRIYPARDVKKDARHGVRFDRGQSVNGKPNLVAMNLQINSNAQARSLQNLVRITGLIRSISLSKSIPPTKPQRKIWTSFRKMWSPKSMHWTTCDQRHRQPLESAVMELNNNGGFFYHLGIVVASIDLSVVIFVVIGAESEFYCCCWHTSEKCIQFA